MDKYEFNLKVDQIRKMVNKGDYGTAKRIADGIDWSKVRSNASLLSMISQVYEKNREYRDAKEILLMAYERAPIGKRLLYKLTELALKEDSIEEAEDYYREFCDLAGDDPRQYLLRYKILKQKNAPKEQMIHSLESYTAEELDEKWLYELALLYHENGDEAQCISTCDRLTLMFGLGKYVDKAIELKQKHAPLSKYQKDLVDNREAYEEKLRMVERSFQEDDEEDDLQDTEIYSEPSTEEAPVPEENRVLKKPEIKEKTVEEEPDLPEAYEEDMLEVEAEQAKTEEYLARELSRMESDAYEEKELEKTRVIGDLRQARSESRHKNQDDHPVHEKEDSSNTMSRPPRRAIHLMIESRDPERGIDIAVEALRQVRQFTGIKNPVAKITGAGLNRRGVLASAEKLAGKDLIIEEAGDMDLGIIDELERLMSRDNTGMRIVLIDNPKQVEMLEKKNPSLAEWFDFIREEDVVEVPVDSPQEAPVEYSSPSYGFPEEEMPADAPVYDTYSEGAYTDVSGYGDASVYGEIVGNQNPYENASDYGEYTEDSYGSAPAFEESMENSYGNASLYGESNAYGSSPEYGNSLEGTYGETGDNGSLESYDYDRTDNIEEDPYRYGMTEMSKEEPKPDNRPVRRVIPVRDQAMRAPDEDDTYNENQEEYSDEEMDIDEFAQYACQYASDIDCSITGKSMLALYERIEIMEEDGIRLTRENAEALIEEAADRAEKPSLGKAIKGIFSSKYNKDGLLILKEEHFI